MTSIKQASSDVIPREVLHSTHIPDDKDWVENGNEWFIHCHNTVLAPLNKNLPRKF